MKRLLLAVVVLVSIAGCETRINENTGQRETRMDPNVAEKIEAGGEAVKGIVDILTPFLGETGLVLGGVLAGVLGTFRKLKPELTTYKKDSEQFHAVALSTVTALDELKKMDNEQWQKVRPILVEELKRRGVPLDQLNNVIRGLRGLQPQA